MTHQKSTAHVPNLHLRAWRNSQPTRLRLTFLLVGLVFTLVGGVRVAQSLTVVTQHPQAAGTITTLDGGYAFARYEVDGAVYQSRTHVNSGNWRVYTVGQAVTVYYPPEQPGAGVVGSWMELWFFPVGFLGMGLVQLGIVLVLVSRWGWPHGERRATPR